MRLGLGKLSCSSSVASAGSHPSSSAVSHVSSFQSMDQVAEIILEENRRRCDFFKFYKFDESDKIGSGCSAFVFKCTRVVDETAQINLQISDSPTLKAMQSSLVVKVCDVEDESVLSSIRNEAKILPKLKCALINKFEACYEDLERNKVYLVLERAGTQTLTDYMKLEENEQLGLPPITLNPNEVK